MASLYSLMALMSRPCLGILNGELEVELRIVGDQGDAALEFGDVAFALLAEYLHRPLALLAIPLLEIGVGETEMRFCVEVVEFDGLLILRYRLCGPSGLGIHSSQGIVEERVVRLALDCLPVLADSLLVFRVLE